MSAIDSLRVRRLIVTAVGKAVGLVTIVTVPQVPLIIDVQIRPVVGKGHDLLLGLRYFVLDRSLNLAGAQILLVRVLFLLFLLCIVVSGNLHYFWLVQRSPLAIFIQSIYSGSAEGQRRRHSIN